MFTKKYLFILFLLIMLVTIKTSLPLYLQDIEMGFLTRPCPVTSPLKKGFKALSSFIGVAASVFLVELLAIETVHKASSDLISIDPLPTSFYIFAASTSSLIGCILGPRISRTLQQDPGTHDTTAPFIEIN